MRELRHMARRVREVQLRISDEAMPHPPEGEVAPPPAGGPAPLTAPEPWNRQRTAASAGEPSWSSNARTFVEIEQNRKSLELSPRHME
eukprot:3352446-Heterocapsa_arctica.AAC.1